MVTVCHSYQLTKAENLSNLRVSVDDWFVFDFACTVSIAQCAKCLLGVAVGWTDARNHQCVTVASQRVCTHTHTHIHTLTYTDRPRDRSRNRR